jgi:hypothetical protein
MDPTDADSVGHEKLSEMVVSGTVPKPQSGKRWGRIEGEDLEAVGKGFVNGVESWIAGPFIQFLLPRFKIDDNSFLGGLVGETIGVGVAGAAGEVAEGVSALRGGGSASKAAAVANGPANAGPAQGPITSISPRSPITSISPKSTVTWTSPRSNVVNSAKAGGDPPPPKVNELVPSVHPDNAPGTTPHPFDGIGQALHPQIFDIIADLQAARAGNAAAAARLATRNPHVLTGDLRGWTSLDIAGRAVGGRFLYRNHAGYIEWKVLSTH